MRCPYPKPVLNLPSMSPQEQKSPLASGAKGLRGTTLTGQTLSSSFEGSPTPGSLTRATRRRLPRHLAGLLRRSSQASSAFGGASPGAPVAGLPPGLSRLAGGNGLLLLFAAFPPFSCLCEARVDPEGLEPSTPTMPLWCAPSCATGPRKRAYDGAEGTRTPDLYSAIVALSQLSHSPFLCDAKWRNHSHRAM